MINTLPKSLIEAARIILTESLGHPMIDVDGVMKHRHNSEGNPIHHTDEGIKNFHKWFNNSTFTDHKGRPLVMYHGVKPRITMKMDSSGNPQKTPDGEFDLDYHTFDVHQFNSSPNGSLGSGVYLTSSRKEAEDYTDGKGAVYPLYANGVPIRKETKLGVTNWTVHPHQLKSAIGNDGTFDHPFRIHESVTDTHIDVDGELKHRYNSEGKLIHPQDEGIRNFHRWFGDSKVTDEHCRPLVVYHGSTSDIPAFDKEHIGKNFGLDSHGFFFTSSPLKAARYADEKSQWALATGNIESPPKEGSNITPVHVSIKNPLTLQHYTWMYDTNPKVEIDDQGISVTDYFDDNRHSIIHHAKQDNHDGILFSHNGDHLVVPFEPHQIKSAIGNTGEFHPNKTNITESTSNRPFTQDEHGKNIVFDNDTYKISVNDPHDATFIALWHGGKKVGAMYLGHGRTSDTKGYATVRSVDIDKKHQGNGMGKHMYRIALQYAHAKYKGIGSEQPDRVNKKQVPSILRRLGGKEHESGDITIER